MRTSSLFNGVLYVFTVCNKLYVIDVDTLKILKEIEINHCYHGIYVGKKLLLLESGNEVLIYNV